MSGQHDASSGFAKAFVPGLVLGLVVGAFVGATLPPLLSGKKLPERQAGYTSSGGGRGRDMIRDEVGMLSEIPAEKAADDLTAQEDIFGGEVGEPVDPPEEALDTPPGESETGGDEGNNDG